MCHATCIDFVKTHLNQKDVNGKSVLDVGACDMNGTVRPVIANMNPSSYIGVDIEMGKGVDIICSAEKLVKRFGKDAFDIVISTEMLEHVKDWKKVITNLKNVIKPNGLLIITTRSKGYEYHGCPYDYWRFEIDDFKDIFCDFEIESLESDLLIPGVFLKAKKPKEFNENNLKNKSLYSMLTNSNRTKLSLFDILLLRVRFYMSNKPILVKIIPSNIKILLKNLYFHLRK